MNARQRLIDPVLAGVLLLFGVAVLYAAAQLGAGTESDPLGPRGFPTLLGAGFVGCGLALLAMSLFRRIGRRDEPAHAEDVEDAGDTYPAGGEDQKPVHRARLLFVSAAIVVYVVVLPILGFLLSSAIFVAMSIILQGGARRLAMLGAVVVFPIIVYVLFAVILGIRLPSGVFDPMLVVGRLMP